MSYADSEYDTYTRRPKSAFRTREAHGRDGLRAWSARPTVSYMVLGLLIGAGAMSGVLSIAPRLEAASTPRVVEYTLTVEEINVTLGDKTWAEWTYNGVVPGPTLTASVGDTLRVHVINQGTHIHSFHTHLTAYNFSMDGSQANVISGIGAGSMIAPGGEYTYEYPLTEPGIFFYHCHSSDGAMISVHIHMGLYGAIIIQDPNAQKLRDEVLFYGESMPGHPAPYVINNRGIPGGEMTLEHIFHEGGITAVAAQFNVALTVMKFKVGETVRLHVINIGDQIHSHHQHGSSVRSTALGGREWPANTVPLVPGTADTLEVTFLEPGMWLFHCHVVIHADMGMIGLFIVE
jgi:FtsP/CotA-like multicopper oxidase with cupredoxin domain